MSLKYLQMVYDAQSSTISRRILSDGKVQEITERVINKHSEITKAAIKKIKEDDMAERIDVASGKTRNIPEPKEITHTLEEINALIASGNDTPEIWAMKRLILAQKSV